MNNRLAMSLLSQTFFRFIAFQLMLTIATSVGILVMSGQFHAVSALFGGFITLVNSSFLFWRKEKMAKETALNAEMSLLLMYRSSLERFLIVAFLLYIGMAQLELDALYLLIGFIIGQLGLFGIGFKQN